MGSQLKAPVRPHDIRRPHLPFMVRHPVIPYKSCIGSFETADWLAGKLPSLVEQCAARKAAGDVQEDNDDDSSSENGSRRSAILGLERK